MEEGSVYITVDVLNRLLGRSFTIVDGTIIEIYMMFESYPIPFFLIKAHDVPRFYQVDAVKLLNMIQHASPDLLNDIIT